MALYNLNTHDAVQCYYKLSDQITRNTTENQKDSKAERPPLDRRTSLCSSSQEKKCDPSCSMPISGHHSMASFLW